MKHIWLSMLFVTLPILAEKQPRQIHLAWTELNAVLRGSEVLIPLADGTEVSGKVEIVGADTIVLERNHTVPRASIQRIRLIEIKGHKRWWGFALGFIGTTAAITGGAHQNGEALWPGWVGLAVGGTAGYVIGRSLDRRVTWITVAPDPIHEPSTPHSSGQEAAPGPHELQPAPLRRN